MATNSKQTNVQLIRKFDDWKYSWWKSLNQRMPWFDAKGTGRMALLTTSSSPTYYPSGSILWAGTDRHPADWILDYGMRDPGVIWYWVNEDDCDEDRKPGRIFPSSFFSFFFVLFLSIRLGPVVQVLDRCYVTNKTFGQNMLYNTCKYILMRSESTNSNITSFPLWDRCPAFSSNGLFFILSER